MTTAPTQTYYQPRYGRMVTRRIPRRPDVWSKAEDQALRRLAGTRPLDELAANWEQLTGGLPRSLNALAVRIRHLGLSRWAQGLSLCEVERATGYDHRTILAHWVQSAVGGLPASRWNGRGPNQGWWIERHDLEQFLRSHPWLYDWRRIRDRQLRALAEVSHRADPWLTWGEACSFIGISDTNLNKWARRGLFEIRRRPSGGKGLGQRMIRARELLAVKERIEQARGATIQQSRQNSYACWGPRDERGRLLRRVG